MRQFFNEHDTALELVVLLVVLFGVAGFIAVFPDNEPLHDWLKGGVIIGVIARALQTNGKKNEPGPPNPPEEKQ